MTKYKLKRLPNEPVNEIDFTNWDLEIIVKALNSVDDKLFAFKQGKNYGKRLNELKDMLYEEYISTLNI